MVENRLDIKIYHHFNEASITSEKKASSGRSPRRKLVQSASEGLGKMACEVKD